MPSQPEGKPTKVYQYAKSNRNVVKMLDLLTAPPHNMARKNIADQIGISSTHLNNTYSGRDPVSKVLDLACEAVLRRFKVGQEETKIMVALVTPTHWPTISMLVKDLGGTVCEAFHALLAEGESGDKMVAIFTVNGAHAAVITQLIKSTGGEVRRTQ